MDCAVKAYEGQENFIFVSYAHDDAHLVYPIIERMVMNGFRVWYDDGIHAGEDWTDKVASRLDASSIVVAMLSENSVASINCRNEIAYSLSARKNLIGIKLTEFDMPGGLRLQLGNTMYLERTRYGETEFYERLSLSHGMGSCRDEERRISDDELIAWRDKWSNATPIRRARKDSEKVILHGPPPSAAALSSSNSAVDGKKPASKKLLIIGAAAVLVLAVLLIVLLPKLSRGKDASSSPSEDSELAGSTNAEPASVENESEWRDLLVEPQGADLQVLSCRYLGGPEIEKIDFTSNGSVSSGCEFDIFFSDNNEIAVVFPAAVLDRPFREDEIDVYRPLVEEAAKETYIPLDPQNPVKLSLSPFSDYGTSTTGGSDYLLLFGANSQGEFVSTIIVEVGVPADAEFPESAEEDPSEQAVESGEAELVPTSPENKDDWVIMDTSGMEGEVCVLSYYVSDGREIANPDAFVHGSDAWISFDWVHNTTVYWTSVASWQAKPFTEADVLDQAGLYLRMWKNDMNMSMSPQASFTGGLPADFKSTQYVLLLGVNEDWDLDCYIILEIGYAQ